MFNYFILTLMIIGALNWGLIGLFSFDLVAFIFNGQTSFLARTIYTLVGLSGLYAISFFVTGLQPAKKDHTSTIEGLNYSTEFSDELHDPRITKNRKRKKRNKQK